MWNRLLDLLLCEGVTPLQVQVKGAVEVGIDQCPVAIATTEVVHFEINKPVRVVVMVRNLTKLFRSRSRLRRQSGRSARASSQVYRDDESQSTTHVIQRQCRPLPLVSHRNERGRFAIGNREAGSADTLAFKPSLRAASSSVVSSNASPLQPNSCASRAASAATPWYCASSTSPRSPRSVAPNEGASSGSPTTVSAAFPCCITPLLCGPLRG